MFREPILIIESNFSIAWAKAFVKANKRGVQEISPLCISVNNLQGTRTVEIPSIRQALDKSLKQHGEPLVQTVASTIFPLSLWNPTKGADHLYKRYEKIFPEIKRICPPNKYGTYFQRFTAFGSRNINQLKRIIQIYKSGTYRRSALQLAVVDPVSDLNGQPRRGFPCLQQVAFNPDPDTGELSLTGFYAMQYLYEKAYGNYIGLYNLGKFVAHEFGMQLAQINCVTAVAKLGRKSKSKLQNLTEQLEECLKTPELY